MPSSTVSNNASRPILSNSETSNSIDSTHPDRVVFRGGSQQNSTNEQHENDEDSARIIPDDEPIAPIRPPIHSKTKNWYSIFCNRWASLIGVRFQISLISKSIYPNFL